MAIENRLFIGANYHPHDWPEERWPVDIGMMKAAGFTTVRLGHLCWDCFEPEDEVYTFEWFDKVMDLFAEAGIGVVLDIPTHPAPTWVHRLCPGCAIHGPSGTVAPALRRYMEDVADPDYQRYALRFTRVLAERYARHPALFAFGLCNEQGAGYLSHSPQATRRFQNWLRRKYGTVERLNTAWVTQRWSRRLGSFEDVALQENEVEKGAPEAWMDMRRFFSDGIADYLIQMKRTVEQAAPGVPHTSNHYSGHDSLGFDYLKYCRDFVDYPGIGFYPDFGFDEKAHYALTVYQERMAELDRPMWCIEYITDAFCQYAGPKGYLWMLAMLTLLHGTQMILGWTWRTMLHGEEQFLYGMLDHDGTPTPSLDEYRRAAADFKRLEGLGFPISRHPQIAVAFNQENQWIGQYHPYHFRQPYSAAIIAAQRALFDSNRDYNMVRLQDMRGSYQLLIIPDDFILDATAAEAVRRFVETGGEVWMTGYSAMLDGDIGGFDVPRPGRLSDVFGIRVAGFERAGQLGRAGEVLTDRRTILRGDERLEISAAYAEHLELSDAEPWATFGDGTCAISAHAYGKGHALYFAPEANADLFSWVLRQRQAALGLKPLPQTPNGVMVRHIDGAGWFYLNTTHQERRIELEKPGSGLLSGRTYGATIDLPPFGGELLITDDIR